MSVNQPLKFDLKALDKFALSMSIDDIFREEMKRVMVVEEAYLLEYFSKFLGIPVETLSSNKIKITDIKGAILRRVSYYRNGIQTTDHTCNGDLIVRVSKFGDRTQFICGSWKDK